MTETRPVRITRELYDRAIELMGKEKETGTRMSRAVTRTETNWFSELIERGIAAYQADEGEER